jgi:hypothetical protein
MLIRPRRLTAAVTTLSVCALLAFARNQKRPGI